MTFQKAFAQYRFFACGAAWFAIICLVALQGCQPPNAQHREDYNHLKSQTSPYLLEHSKDPVNWYPWGDEAFVLAKREDKPIFLSSGFAACHWCHVMQRESFADPATAKILNDNFVSIKVDREERPYVDEVYSRAAQVIGGRSGWPLTVFLTPDKKPFFAGTYFPKADMNGMPSFTKVLESVLDSWHKKRAEIDKIANELCLAIYKEDGSPTRLQPDQTTIDRAGSKILALVDRQWGGLDGERKFASPGTLALAMQLIVSDPREQIPATKDYLAYVTTTLNQMALGGIHDQLNGGFFRYATDRYWHIPHFEKMLCDNALIAQSYMDAGLLTGNSHWQAIGLDTLDFCMRAFATENGSFFSSMDADSDGREGGFYTFTPEEIKAALGAEDGQFFCTIYNVSSKGNTKDGRSVLYCLNDAEKLAQSSGLKLSQFQEKVETLKNRLAQSELIKKRVLPAVDKKVIASWNALMISALVEGYKVSGNDKYLAAAKKCALFLLNNLCQKEEQKASLEKRNIHSVWQGNTIHRIWADGKAEISGCLDDYSYTIRALLDLASVDSDPTWLRQAGALNDTVVAHFFSHRVGFYYTANNKEQALLRTSCARDNGGVSPAGIEVSNLVRLSEISNNDHLKSTIERTVKPYGDDVIEEPAAYAYLLAAMDRALHQSERLAIVDGQDKVVTRNLEQVVWQYYAPHVVEIVIGPRQFATLGQQGSHSASGASNGRSAAYFCHSLSKSCDKPLTDPIQLKAKLSDLAAQGGL